MKQIINAIKICATLIIFFINFAVAQNIINKLGGDSSSEKFQITNHSGDIKLQVQGDGMVGIGTTSPKEKLDINGNIAVSGFGMWHHSGIKVLDNQPSSTNWSNLNLSNIVGTNHALVLLKIKSEPLASSNFIFRPKGETDEYFTSGVNAIQIVGSNDMPSPVGLVICETDSSGYLEWRSTGAERITVWILGFIK